MVSESTGMLLMIGAMGLITFMVMVTFVVLIYVGYTTSSYLPLSVKYPSITGGRILGTKPIATYADISQSDCLQHCEDIAGCMSVNYAPDDRKCQLFSTSKTIDSTMFEGELKGTDYYEKAYFWGRFSPKQTGSMKDFGSTAPLTGVTSDQECAVRCLKQNKNPECKGFNYSSTDQKCKLLGSALEGNEKYIDATDTNYVYYGVLPYTIASDPKLVAEPPPPPAKDPATPASSTPAKKESFDVVRCQNKPLMLVIIVALVILVYKYRRAITKVISKY